MSDQPTKLPENEVDDALSPGLKIPETHDVEERDVNTKDGEVTATVYTFKELVEIEAARWRMGNPEFDGAAYGEEVFRLRFKCVDPDSPNVNRRVEDQFLRFYMGLVTQSWEQLRAIKDAASKGDFERRLGALKFETLGNMRFMKKFLKATGYADRLSAARKNFIDFTTIQDLIEEKQFNGTTVLITIEKGEPNYKGVPLERVVNIEAV